MGLAVARRGCDEEVRERRELAPRGAAESRGRGEAEQAKILFAEAEENNLELKVLNARLARWRACSLCKQDYHGVVSCALGWACWKTYVGRPEGDQLFSMAMNLLGVGLHQAGHLEDALSVREAMLSILLRIGGPEKNTLLVQGNLASTYHELGRLEEALNLYRDVYSGELKLYGAEHRQTLISVSNYASALIELKHYEEAKSLLRKIMPVLRRILGDNDRLTLSMRCSYAQTIYKDPTATLDDLHAAVTTLEDAKRTARRVLGGAHPVTGLLEHSLEQARSTFDAP